MRSEDNVHSTAAVRVAEEAEMRRPSLGLTRQEARAVRVIQTLTRGPVTPSYREIGKSLGTVHSGVARIIAQLETKGWLTRSPYRARSLTVLVTIAVGEEETAADWAISISAPLTTLNVDVQAAIGAAARAESARDAALVGNDFYADTTAGLADPGGVAEGETFRVLAGDGKSFTLYRHEAGPVATAIASFATKLLIDEALGELDDARQGAASVAANLTGIKGSVAAVEAATKITGFSGVEEPEIAGTGATARTIVLADRALFDRVCTQITFTNNTGVSRVARLRRMVDNGGADLDAADDNVDINVTVPAADPPQAVTLPTPWNIRAGEWPGLAGDNNTWMNVVVGAGLGVPHYIATGNVQSVPKSTLRDDLAVQLRIDWKELAVDGVDYREQRGTVAQNTADVAQIKADLYTPVVIGRPGELTAGTSIFAGNIVFKRLSTKQRRITRMVMWNGTDQDRDIVVQRQRIAGSNLVKVPGTTDIPLTVPAGPGFKIVELGDASFVQPIGETCRVWSATTGWATYVSGPGDEDGLLHVPGGATDTIPLDSTSFDSIRVMMRFEGVEVAFDTEGGGGGGTPAPAAAPQVVVDIASSDLLMIAGNSFAAGTAGLKDKCWPAKVSEATDYAVEVYAVAGTTVGSRIAGIRANTPINGNVLGPQDYRRVRRVIANFARNEAGASVPITDFDEDMRQFNETVVNGLGAMLTIIAEHADAWDSPGDTVAGGTGGAMMMQAIADELGADFIDVRLNGEFLGRAPGDPDLWQGSHPGTRANDLWYNPVKEYIDQLGRPRQVVKIFRPRDGASVSSAADLFFANNDDRERRWKEIGLSHIALTYPWYWDNLDAHPFGAQNTAYASERLAFMAGNALSFNGYALVYCVLAHLAQDMTGVEFRMDDIGADVLIPDGLAGAVANGVPVGDWVQVAEDDDGRFPISDLRMRKAMRFDAIPVMVRKTGAFSLTTAQIVYTPTGPEKPQPRIVDRRPVALGTEMVTNPTFPDDGSPPTGWTVTGGIVGTTTEDHVANKSHLPYGADGAVTVGPGKTMTTNLLYDASPFGRQAQLIVTCRRKVAKFSSAGGDLTGSPVTPDTFDKTRLRISQIDDTQAVGEDPGDIVASTSIANQSAEVGLWWKRCVLNVRIPANTDNQDVKVTADADTEVVIVSCRPILA